MSKRSLAYVCVTHLCKYPPAVCRRRFLQKNLNQLPSTRRQGFPRLHRPTPGHVSRRGATVGVCWGPTGHGAMVDTRSRCQVPQYLSQRRTKIARALYFGMIQAVVDAKRIESASSTTHALLETLDCGSHPQQQFHGTYTQNLTECNSIATKAAAHG